VLDFQVAEEIRCNSLWMEKSYHFNRKWELCWKAALGSNWDWDFNSLLS